MLHRLPTSFTRILCKDPADTEVVSRRPLVRARYIRRATPGAYTWLSLGLQTLRKIEDIVRQEMDAMGGQEIYFPALLSVEPCQATGRWDDYDPTLFRLRDRKGGDYLLAPTHEEMFTLAAKDLYSSYKDLPAVVYQTQAKCRDEVRSHAGIIRDRKFVMKDSYFFGIDDTGLAAAYQTHRDTYERIFTHLGLGYVIANAMVDAMGKSHSEGFLRPCEIDEDTFMRSSSGHTANAKVVATAVPEPVDASRIDPVRVVDTPGTPTIDSLVELCNRAYPHSDGWAWTTADALKDVVVTLTHPGGEYELLVVGVPRGRSTDMKRLGAAVAPAEVEMAGDTDSETHSELVHGYIDPSAIGPNSPLRRVEKREDGTEIFTGSMHYLVDPRIAGGTSWITGANSDKKYAPDLVMGRGFTIDDTVEAAEVREGDPAPGGSGPLHLAHGIEINHIFELEHKYSQALRPTVLDENGKARVVTMGPYGIGVSRVMAALAEASHDDKGLAWPAQITPCHMQVLVTDKDQAIFDVVKQVASPLDVDGVEVLYDDRRKVSTSVRFANAELLGLPYTLVIGRNLAEEGAVEVRDRCIGERRSVPTGATATKLSVIVRAALEAVHH